MQTCLLKRRERCKDEEFIGISGVAEGHCRSDKQGRGYLEEAPDIKFSQKNFKSTLESSPELQKAFAKECYNVLVHFLSNTRTVSKDENSISLNISNMITSMGTSEPAFV